MPCQIKGILPLALLVLREKGNSGNIVLQIA
jgi:hypothetical protein